MRNFIIHKILFSLLLLGPIVCFAQANGYAYISNAGADNVSVINTATNLPGVIIPVGTTPAGVSVSPDGSKVYVTNNGSDDVSVISTITNTVMATIPVATGPIGVAVSPDGSRTYVTGGTDSVSVINTATNTVIATIHVGTGPTGVVFSPNGTRAYVAGGDDSISVINTGINAVIATVIIDSFPAGVAISPDGSKLYVANNGKDKVTVINTASNTVAATITVVGEPLGLALSTDGSRLYVTCNLTDNVVVINTATNSIVATIPVGTGPVGISARPAGGSVYVANSGSDDVSVINTATNTVSATLPAGLFPVAFGNFITGSVAVPVTLNNAKAFKKNAGVQVEWRAEQEINIENYLVERSQNARQFTAIGTANATGNGNTLANYSLYDAKPFNGINFYRIKVLEKDGKLSYSQVMKVNMGNDATIITVYPNPITGNNIGLEFIDLPKGNYSITLTDITGKLVSSKTLETSGGSLKDNIAISKNMAAGVYMLTLRGEGINITKQVIKR